MSTPIDGPPFFIDVESRNGYTSYLNAQVTLLPLENNDKFKVFIALVCSLNNAEYLNLMDSTYGSIGKSEMT